MVTARNRRGEGKRFWILLVTSMLMVALLGSNGFSMAPIGSPAVLAANTHAARGGTVVIDNVSGSLWTCSFNPYSSSVNFLSDGIIYEPLVYINGLTNQVTPWLATSYSWGNNNKTLSFTIRNGVNWSDGKPFSVKDVVFTFNLMKKFPALDLQAVWSVLTSVKAQGANRVVMTFKQPSVPFFYYIADQEFMIPEHIWSRVKKPDTYLDKNPVGTGPFKLGQCAPQNISYTRNARYWQPGKPSIDKVVYPAFMDNQPGNLYLAQGKADWGGQYIPNVNAYYISRDPAHRHYWYPPGTNVYLYPNLTAYPLNNLKVRQALSYALDRAKISRIGVFGYLPPANQAGVVIPTFKSWYDQSLANRYAYRYFPAKATQLLVQAGFHKGSNGMFQDRKGKPLSLSVINIGGYTDWVAELEVTRNSLRQIGIDVKVENLSSNEYISRRAAGRFQLAYGTATGGPVPYYEFRSVLDSANTAPIGKPAASNFERWRDARTDNLLSAYDRTTSVAQQHVLINQLQAVMLQNVPVIPVLEGVNWFQYDTSRIVGWPTQSNQYANPAPYNFPDWEVVLLNVHKK